jgi:LuxR family maltose regulon positive regulatory protein
MPFHYHVIDAQPIDHASPFARAPANPDAPGHRHPRSHRLWLVARRGYLTELRALPTCATATEAAEFLNQVMGLNLSVADVAALEARTEGWIAGLQLAAISMQGQEDTTCFIQSFTGSHHFVLDYLIEEVLCQQSEAVQTFLLHSSVLDQMCGPLCDAVLPNSPVSGQEALDNVTPADMYFGRYTAVMTQRERIKQQTLQHRREHYLQAALYSG